VYRFLLSPRWLGGLALAIAAATVMVFLGIWQWHRYEERTAVNNRIDAADTIAALPLTSVLSTPTTPGTAGHVDSDRSWTKVTVAGRYDPAHEIQARGRTVNGDVGFEIVTPLVLADGTAVLIDRGWVPESGDALSAPKFPAAPTGPVTVVGQIHLSESRSTPVQHRDGRLDTRRISVPRLARAMPYPMYGAYVLLTAQTPPASTQFTQIPIDHEDAWMNAGYTVQWWLFAGMALFAFGWQARKEALGENPPPKSARQPVPARPSPALASPALASPALASPALASSDRASSDRASSDRASSDRVADSDLRRAVAEPALDRVAESDLRLAAASSPVLDRVAESDRRRAAAKDAPAGRVGRFGRRAAKPAAQADPTLDRVAESDLRAAEQAAESARRPD
jgi:cytochrome oxidase assembly protein ShyY1